MTITLLTEVKIVNGNPVITIDQKEVTIQVILDNGQVKTTRILQVKDKGDEIKAVLH